MTYTLCVPRWRPPLCNVWRGWHWSKAHRLRKEAKHLLAAYAHQQRVPQAAGQRRVFVEVVLGPQQRQSDRDSFDKLLLDALVGCGLLLDDGERGLAGRVEVTFRRAGRGEWWGTILSFEETP